MSHRAIATLQTAIPRAMLLRCQNSRRYIDYQRCSVGVRSSPKRRGSKSRIALTTAWVLSPSVAFRHPIRCGSLVVTLNQIQFRMRALHTRASTETIFISPPPNDRPVRLRVASVFHTRSDHSMAPATIRPHWLLTMGSTHHTPAAHASVAINLRTPAGSAATRGLRLPRSIASETSAHDLSVYARSQVTGDCRRHPLKCSPLDPSIPDLIPFLIVGRPRRQIEPPRTVSEIHHHNRPSPILPSQVGL